MKHAVLFPGQGAQVVGMGKDFYDNFLEAKEVFQEADEILSESLSTLIFEGPVNKLSETRHCQVALFVTSIALLRTIQKQVPSFQFGFAAGLSLGEYSAYCAASVLSFADAVELVKQRGELMHTCSVKNPGSMSVALGQTEEQIREMLGDAQGVWIANLNCPGQVVISGTVSGIENATKILKEAGVKRVLPLNVSGAFHSPLMNEARERLEEEILKVTFTPSNITVLSNAKGGAVVSEGEMRESLIHQVVAPVYWEKDIRYLESEGVSTYFEIGAGNTLAGMNKRIGVEGQTITVSTVQDLELLEKQYAS